MSISKVLGLGSAVILITGCQSWQFRDIERLPPTAAIPQESEPGKVDVWYFDGISGETVDSLTSAAAYPDSPSEITELNQLENLQNRANNYGTLIRGYIEAPQTGEYTFYVAGDDETQFWLSESENPDLANQIATTGRATAIGDYTRYSSQTSPSMYLETGRRYYFELRHKEGGWDDHFSVAWEGPGTSRQVVSGDYLHSYAQQTPAAEKELTPEEAYETGYRVGFFDAEQGLAFTPDYPPLDADGDGLYDNWEVVYGLSPVDPADANSDQDNDLLNALDEFWSGTDPTNSDTDGDGLPDGYEFAYGLNPRDPSDATVDLDGDGYSVLEEYQAGTDPTDPADTPVQEPEYTGGFVGQYFSGTGFDEFLYTQKDPTIQFNWGSGSPSPDIPNNNFSIRWQGWFVPPHTDGIQSYQLTTRTDDGVRLFVNGELVIDQWKNQSATSYSNELSVGPDERVAITMEYYEAGWDASAAFSVTDQQTGTELDASTVIESLDLTTSPEISSLGDGITDIYKLRYGLPLLQPTADLVLNNEGVTVLEAYQSGLHPYTLETVSEPDAPITETAPTEPATSTVTLNWTAPGTRVDGSSISLSEISHYEINYGQSTDSLDQEVRVEADDTSYTLEGLAQGTWYFTIRVVDTDGLTSQASDTVEVQVQ
ncbi:PA14 domain-containing protein [Marinobacter sp. TBZ242]|uniref:PA14 domain-containing protein n=1 Tax=Marinobacter azerbaijanicus TaxID=3050455 RepID=A0ABT7I6I6_9GAMM|nr:PA14 domain-containing protein [Marinobacter sp. TBZ242]MDL0429697.1 PA14 domain-containing protein [Marinobacter sp. TBZ242]